MSDAPRVAVAVSGGLDSTALLHCTARIASRVGAEVHALHVHHGLQPEADMWMAGVAEQCRRWRRAGHPVTFHGQRVRDRPARGDSIEAWARRVRYQALAEMAQQAGCGLLLLAHHRRDQAETVLLQALRGGGPAGLSAMPRSIERQGLRWVRPWLDLPREAIEAYARRWRLRHVLDPSNADERLARGRLREQVWPVLSRAFADAEGALAAVAGRAQEARDIMDEVARQDAALLIGPRGLEVVAWRVLPAARRANVLRHWLGRERSAAVPESLIQRLMHELPGMSAGRWPAPAGEELALHAGWLQRITRVAPRAVHAPRVLDLSQPGSHDVQPWAGSIRVESVEAGGLPASLVRQAELRTRVGGEHFQLQPRGQARCLKKQFQARGVPAWKRGGPLVFAQDRLVFVPGLGLDARAAALPGQPRVQLSWQD